MMQATAKAHANVALVKYFGKRELSLNLPRLGSLSMTLDALNTQTSVRFDTSLNQDLVQLGGQEAPQAFAARVSRFLDIVRSKAGVASRAHVNTDNSFPTAAGLASSASGFAALALAATSALKLDVSDQELSALARRGSGSACRSVSGGISVWQAGELDDGSDSYAYSICPPYKWDLRMVIGVVQTGPKSIGSTEAMEQVRRTSPLYDGWIWSVKQDLPAAIDAVEAADFTTLGEIAEHSALSMHGACLGARPPILYWRSTTVEAIHLARQLRTQGIEAYFTCDAGPQPKLLCTPKDLQRVEQALFELCGVQKVISSGVGGGVNLVPSNDA